MNNKIIIVISVVITIGIIVFSLTQIDENKTSSKFEGTDEISSMLKKIEEDKIKNDESDSPYVPAKRDWPSSGPIKIDRSQYVLGEKVFINFDEMNENVRGKLIISKITNFTHGQIYKTIDFRGGESQQNVYFGIYPSLSRQFCTADDLVGNWEVIFEGVNLESIQFKIIDEMIPGMDYSFESVC
ncbi:hypothetical protein [Candidatus Nitrosomarinus catalina]|uniref:hypothetical protein n=1 Tax=Candidatus Nitrosomarinus catalinensis TaxID=1898749 RepID=UPI0012602685|nr:hypothetical protein [Candidatus Nitrosomarinus catalina]